MWRIRPYRIRPPGPALLNDYCQFGDQRKPLKKQSAVRLHFFPITDRPSIIISTTDSSPMVEFTIM